MSKIQPVKEPEQWSVRRWKQLQQLEQLLQDCNAIDRANCVIERMQRLIKNSRKFLENRRTGEQSFVQFLQDHARYGFANRKRKRRKKAEQPNV